MVEMTLVRRTVGVILAILIVPVSAFSAEVGQLPEVVEFNRDIRPILSDNCFACHGPDKNKRQADLRLDTDASLTSGKNDPAKPAVIVAGKPLESEFVHRINSKDPEQIMPPVDSGKRLSPRDIALLQRWIEQGAKYEGHWSFLPIKRPAIPSLEQGPHQAGQPIPVVNPIDSFVRTALVSSGLSPSAEADRVMLIRRLSLDLIGLPPTPEQVDAFLQDKSNDAYERVVDRLLESPHYGERLAIWWLDLVRYADTVGYHGDQDVSVSPFRQFVIESFNANKPFNQFTVEQLAGDLLPNPTREQMIASGYNRLGMMSAEGGVQDKEYLAKYIAERVRNASGTWLGVTLGCCECHDHKYDPFTTRDFYRFEAFFADIEERGLYSGASADGNWGRNIRVPTLDQEVALAAIDQKIAATKVVLDTPTHELATAQIEWETTQTVWNVLKPDSMTSENGATLSLKEDGSILVSGTSPPHDTYVLQMKDLPSGITALRLEVLPDDSLPKKGPGRATNGNFVLSEFTIQQKLTNGETQPVPLQNPTADYEQTGAAEGNPYGKWAIAAAIDGDLKGKNWGWAVMEKVGKPHVAMFETVQDIAGGEGSTMTISLLQNLENSQHSIGHFRISATKSPRPIRVEQSLPQPINSILLVAPEQRTTAQRNELAAYYRSVAPALEKTRQALAEYEKERKELDARIPRTLVTASVQPRMVRILRRGNWMDESGEVVAPAFPGILSTSAPGDSRLTRLDLARWMTSVDNPLTARVFANRVWKLLFGAGLSRRVDDLGAQGDWPSHPQLLDHLAGQFIDSGWNIKRLIKTIVMSETYRQTSIASHKAREIDPYNRWLARQGRFRLDAELVRDNALAISGLLVSKIGGTSVKPYQPPGYWSHLNFPTREWQNGSGDDLYRRGLYTHWQRQYLHPSLLAFDAPSREECTADRARSNTPLQSLVLLNDPSYVEAARAFAEQLIRYGGPTSYDRLKFAFRRAVSREITPAETTVLVQLLQKHLDEYKTDEPAATELLSVGAKPAPTDLNKTELAAWTSVARALLNLHETITRN
jgi:hypothetical protein